MDIVLASASPRRKQLLRQIFASFRTCPTHCEESPSGRPSTAVMRIASDKADAYVGSYDVLISADTVVYDGKIIGKPRDEDDAFGLLKRLCGKKHYVYTGVCIKAADKKVLFYEKSTIKIKKMSDVEIRDYIRDFRPLDKAGAYGIQDGVAEWYRGSYSNIMGLPLERLREELESLKITEHNAVPCTE